MSLWLKRLIGNLSAAALDMVALSSSLTYIAGGMSSYYGVVVRHFPDHRAKRKNIIAVAFGIGSMAKRPRRRIYP